MLTGNSCSCCSLLWPRPPPSPACLHLHLFSNQISNEIFIKLINISAGLSQASLLRYRAVDASNACAAAPADVPASDWPRLKYALGIIRAAARNLPHTRIYQTAGDAEFDKCVRRKKKTLPQGARPTRSTTVPKGGGGVALCG